MTKRSLSTARAVISMSSPGALRRGRSRSTYPFGLTHAATIRFGLTYTWNKDNAVATREEYDNTGGSARPYGRQPGRLRARSRWRLGLLTPRITLGPGRRSTTFSAWAGARSRPVITCRRAG
jgi:hypothetical protein